jgi:hypothetical protein
MGWTSLQKYTETKTDEKLAQMFDILSQGKKRGVCPTDDVE